MQTKKLTIRDLKLFDMFKFANDLLNRVENNKPWTLVMEDKTGYENRYVSFSKINEKGEMTDEFLMYSNYEVILLGNARDKFPKLYSNDNR